MGAKVIARQLWHAGERGLARALVTAAEGPEDDPDFWNEFIVHLDTIARSKRRISEMYDIWEWLNELDTAYDQSLLKKGGLYKKFASAPKHIRKPLRDFYKAELPKFRKEWGEGPGV